MEKKRTNIVKLCDKNAEGFDQGEFLRKISPEKLYDLIRTYIGDGKFTEIQITCVNKFISHSKDTAVVVKEIRKLIAYLQNEDFDYNFEQFVELVKKKHKPVKKTKEVKISGVVEDRHPIKIDPTNLLNEIKNSSGSEQEYKLVSFNNLLNGEDVLTKIKWQEELRKTLDLTKGQFSELNKELYRKSKLPTETVKEKPPVDKRFEDPQLIEYLWKELDQNHKLDHKEKLAVFLICVSGELLDHKDHCSGALKGDSSTGKDSLIEACFKLFPDDDNFFLTRATSAALEEEVHAVKRIAFSEINKDRDGANSQITETFKQLSEGGVNVIKRDPETGFKTTKNITIGQKSLLYGTTETAKDDELETRYVIISVKGYSHKNKIVVEDLLKKSRDINYYVNRGAKISWVSDSIAGLDEDLQVIIPFTEVFENKILDEDGKEKYLFDYTKERIKRDSKRLMSLTRAVTWLYQKQRKIVEVDGMKFVYAEPSDFLLTLEIFSDFFNLTYGGLDHRLIKCHEAIKENVGKHSGEISKLNFPIEYTDWVLRHKIQAELGIESINTIKKHISKLNDHGRIEVYYNPNITNKAYLIRPVNSPVNKVSLPISITAIDRSLTGWLTGNNLYEKELMKIKTDFLKLKLPKNTKKNTCQGGKLTGEKLTCQSGDLIHLKKTDSTYQKCFDCGETPCKFVDVTGKTYCSDCSTDNSNFIVEETVC